jgi:hypothetical protein
MEEKEYDDVEMILWGATGAKTLMWSVTRLREVRYDVVDKIVWIMPVK